MFSINWWLNFSFLVLQICHWLWCWHSWIHPWSSLHPWLASIPNNKYHTQGSRYLWIHWWCDCCSSPQRIEGLYWFEIGNQRILQDRGYNHSLPYSCGKHPLCLFEFCQLLLKLCVYFCVNSSDECITPSHRKWWKPCKPCQNMRNCSRPYKKQVLMCTLSSNT